MKLKLILINLVNIVFYLAWLGYTYMKAQSGSYNTSGYSSGPPNITFVYVMVTIIIIASIIFSFAGPANITAKLVWIPIIVIFLGEGFITYKEQRIYNEKIKKRELFESKLKIKVDKISKDYMLKNEEAEKTIAFMFSFLTHETDFDEFYRIDVGRGYGAIVIPLGKVIGSKLEIFDEPSIGEFYKNYVDKDGKTIFDKYEINYNPDQDYDNYHSDIDDRLSPD